MLTWKLDANLTSEQTADLADQVTAKTLYYCSRTLSIMFFKTYYNNLKNAKALLAFVKALIELARYQNYICNFSVAATARLYKRFPEYNVRIGSGMFCDNN